MDKLTVRDIDIAGKRVLVRVDYNVPLDGKTGAVTDDTRLRATLPTIKYLLDKKARIILASHLGRPKGKVNESMRLVMVVRRLVELLGQPVKMAPDCIGPQVERMVAELKPGEALLLENLRFHPEEEAGDEAFARSLAKLADIYVNDAFGASHRAHASITGVARFLPAVAGFLLEKELDNLGKLLKNPSHPFVALLGGAKVSDKVGMMQNILGRVDSVLIGGGMAATFLKAKKIEVGKSLLELDKLDFAVTLMEDASRRGVKLVLPSDVLVAKDSEDARSVPVDAVPKDCRIVDIGPETLRVFSDELCRSRTVFWNGPMGIFENPAFAGGTRKIARLLADLKGKVIIGGGSTSEAVTEMGLADKMTFVSTGGGASLEFLSGDVLPGVAALRDKAK